MNGYQLIAAMRKVRAETYLSTADQALFHELIAFCNEAKWKEIFFVKSSMLCNDLGMSDNTLRKSRKSLAAAGLISYEPSRDKRIGCYYSFTAKLRSVTASSAPVADDKKASPATSSAPAEEDAPITPIIENIKTLNRETPRPAKRQSAAKKEADAMPLRLPFASERFLAAWEVLRKSPKWEKKHNYALQLSLDKLGRFEEDFAIAQMERAAESNWTGVVFAETEFKYREWLKCKYGKPSNTSEQTSSGAAAQRKAGIDELTSLSGDVLRAIAAQKFG